MSVLTLADVRKSYGPLDLLRGVSFFVSPGRRVGLIGANGAGKTTLLRLITGAETPDSGILTLQPGALVGLLSQDPEFEEGATVLESAERPTVRLQHIWREMTELERQGMADEAAVERHDELHHEFQALGGYECAARARQILPGLGFQEPAWGRSAAVLSGGERTRLAMAQLLIRQPDLLLLDEPTNHVDWEACEWLQTYLSRYPGAALIVSHDRYFLDDVAQEIVELERGRARVYQGNYTAFRRKKELDLEQAAETARRRAEEIQRQQAVIQRLRSHRKFDSMHSREKVLSRLEAEHAADPAAAGRREARNLRIYGREAVSSGREVLTASELAHGYGERPLFGRLSFALERGDRLAVVGPNGAGKTTLLRILAGELAPNAGRVEYGFRVQPAYFAQDLSTVDPDATVWETIWETGAVNQTEAMQALHQFLFVADALERPVADLSGGERTRLALCRLLLVRPNLLLLDEPTNHLDLPSREAVEKALCAYSGAIVVVSHDRYFLDATATRILELRDGKTTLFDDGFRRFVERRRAPAPAPPARKPASAPPVGRRLRTVSPAKLLPRLEKEIAELEARQREITSLMGGDWLSAATLTAEYESLAGRLSTLYGEWEQVAQAAGVE